MKGISAKISFFGVFADSNSRNYLKSDNFNLDIYFHSEDVVGSSFERDHTF